MAASPRLAARPATLSSRTVLVAVAVAGVVVLSLAFVHALVALVVLGIAPGLVAMAFAGSIRDQFHLHARVAALASGFTGASWLIAIDAGETNLPSVLIGAMVSALLLVALAWFFAWLLDTVRTRRDAWRA